jgi:hypothetical protein
VAELKAAPLAPIREKSAQLEEAWAVRITTMNALVDYANSVQAIVEAGKKGEDSARKLADAANGLTQSLSVVSPGASAAGGVAVDTLTFAYDQIAKARAAKNLESALVELQPAIDRIAVLLGNDLRNLDELVQIAVRAERDALADANQSELAYRHQLIATQHQLMGSIRAELGEDKKPSELTRVDELNRISQMLAQNESWNAGYERNQAIIIERGRIVREIIAETRFGFSDWASAHAGLLKAVRTKHATSAAELLSTVDRIHGLVERYRQL